MRGSIFRIFLQSLIRQFHGGSKLVVSCQFARLRRQMIGFHGLGAGLLRLF